MCLGCLHRCPKFAIQYDDRTREHGQYRHPGTRVRFGALYRAGMSSGSTPARGRGLSIVLHALH